MKHYGNICKINGAEVEPVDVKKRDKWEISQIPLSVANDFVIRNHRHHDAVQGHKFSLGLFSCGELRGVVIVGRPVGRYLDDGKTIEVTRLCTDGAKNACSMLYSAAARKAKEMGFQHIITYILESENGASLKASNWILEAERCGKPEWNTERYANKPKQLSLFIKKTPPKEYKKRYGKFLI